MHYFLVVSRGPDGTLHAFIRNPEANAGAWMGTRTVLAEGANVRFRANGKPDVMGSVSDGSITIDALPPGGTTVTFHRPSPEERRWYYPRPTDRWVYREPVAADDGWAVGTLAGAGLRESPISEVIRGIVSMRSPVLRSPYIQSVAIARDGRLVLDEYFYGFTAATPHDVRSAGKSVTSLLVGRAIEDTHDFTPQSTVLSILTQYSRIDNDDRRKRAITVGNLLSMSSGLACDDDDDASPGNEDTMQSQTSQPDWYLYALDLPMQYDPGTRAAYCTAGINLLGAVVARATHRPLEDYFYERFASPMRFGRYAMWLMPPPTDAAYMGGGDYFRPRDFLKFGELFLSAGRWHGVQILSESWLRESVVYRATLRHDAAGEGDRYGYGWHLGTLAIDGRRYAVVDAGGNGGQLLVIVPKLDLVVMIAGRELQPVSRLERVFAADRRGRYSSGNGTLDSKQRARVRVGRRDDVRKRNGEHLRQLRRRVCDERRFVALSAHRHRREIGAIGLEHEMRGADGVHRFAKRVRVGKREHPADAQVERELVDARACFARRSGEAMHDPAHALPPLVAEDGHEVGEGIALMKDHRHAGFARDAQLRAQHVALERRAGCFRNSSRAPSRRWRRPAAAPEAGAARRRYRPAPRRRGADGCRRRPRFRSAAPAIAIRLSAMSSPTVTMAERPAERARATTSSRSGSNLGS